MGFIGGTPCADMSRAASHAPTRPSLVAAEPSSVGAGGAVVPAGEELGPLRGQLHAHVVADATPRSRPGRSAPRRTPEAPAIPHWSQSLGAERRRNRTYPPPGYDGQPVLKTGWGTSP